MMMGDWHGEVNGGWDGVPSKDSASSDIPRSARLPAIMRMTAKFDQMAAAGRDAVLASSVEEVDGLTEAIRLIVAANIKDRLLCAVCGLAFVGLRSILETGGVAGVVEKVDAEDVSEVVRLRKLVKEMGERIACQSEALARAAERKGTERSS